MRTTEVMVNYTKSCGANNFAVVRTITSILIPEHRLVLDGIIFKLFYYARILVVVNFPVLKINKFYGAITESRDSFNYTPYLNIIYFKLPKLGDQNLFSISI